MASPFQPLPKAVAKDNNSTNGNGANPETAPKLFDTALRKKRILHVEFDRTLLAVRHALLETAGFEVISCFSSLAMREVSTATLPFDLLLIGHSASVAERNELIAWMKGIFPNTPVLVLKARVTDTTPAGDIASTADPEELLRTIVEALIRE